MNEDLECEPQSLAQTEGNTKLEMTKSQKVTEESSQFLWGKIQGKAKEEGSGKAGES